MKAAHWKLLIALLGSLVLFYLFLLLLPFPELEAYRKMSYGTVISDRNGNVLRVLPADDGIKREWAPLGEIPLGAQKIFIRAEDRRFYFHPGVDLISLAGSLHRNVKNRRIVSGASTITMQLARLVHPHSGGMGGKIREAWDAVRIEVKLSKREILELWLNGIPFGSNVEGLPAMARARFGRSVWELDETRVALLAVVPRRPGLYDPAVNQAAAVSAALALSDRCGLGLMEEELLEAAREAVRPSQGPADPRAPFLAPHFTERIAGIVSSSGPYANAKGRMFHSTLDLGLQRYAEEQLAIELSQLTRNRISNGAILAIENETGEVRIYLGSASWFDDSVHGKIDGIRFRAQPGSCLKPFLYAMALDSGFSPADIMPDLPTVFGSSEAYIPSNFNNRFNGPVRFRIALASSLNIPAVYLLRNLGVRAFEEYLIDLGFDSIRDRMGSHGTGLALGNAEVSLEEMVRAFSAFPRGGTAAALKMELGVSNEQSPQPQMSPYSAWAIADILSDRSSRFVGFGPAPSLATPFESMFKTGTANQFQQIWALGATKRFTVGVWMGNFSGETVIGSTGSSVPARIASKLLDALEQSAGEPVDAVEGIAGPLPQGTLEQRLCSLSGMEAGPYCTGLVREWLQIENIKPACTWHSGAGLFYPPEYRPWLVERARAGSTRPEGGGRIRIPVNGSVYYLDPSLPPEAQALRVETIGFSTDALLYANDTLMGSLNYAGVYALPLSRGRHTVLVEDLNGASASAYFEIR